MNQTLDNNILGLCAPVWKEFLLDFVFGKSAGWWARPSLGFYFQDSGWICFISKFNSFHGKMIFFCIFEVKIQLLERRDDRRLHIWYVTWTYFDRKYNSAKFTHLWLDFWVDFFVFHVYALKNIKIYPFLCIKIKNQNSCGIVSMQKLIIATVVISRLNMFQKCPILVSLGLFSFHGGSQKISKIDSKIFKNALKTFYT